jgi:GH24 family phage-related lysozyme (muramidase)
MTERYRVFIDLPRLLARIKKEEGFRPESYWDDAPGGGGGQYTWGFGTVAPGPGATIDEETAAIELEGEIWGAVGDYRTAFPADPPGLTEARHESIIDMLFNLGLTRFLGFQNTIAAIRSGEWSRAASLAKQSLWYKQVGARARRIVRELDTGEFCPPE